jgi:hypothetical protein
MGRFTKAQERLPLLVEMVAVQVVLAALLTQGVPPVVGVAAAAAAPPSPEQVVLADSAAAEVAAARIHGEEMRGQQVLQVNMGVLADKDAVVQDQVAVVVPASVARSSSVVQASISHR